MSFVDVNAPQILTMTTRRGVCTVLIGLDGSELASSMARWGNTGDETGPSSQIRTVNVAD